MESPEENVLVIETRSLFDYRLCEDRPGGRVQLDASCFHRELVLRAEKLGATRIKEEGRE